ncbi:MAG TPA: CPBP family intramembrane glutamic endopeptidase [Polyangiaceae bacterium]|nr:CPBP family intramembrane glutamic endopeptidase [Polyangiaceae bacterium]
MNEPRPRAPSTGRVIWLVGKLSWSRLSNRWARRRGVRPGERGATARKPSAGRLVIAVASVLFALQAVMGSTVLIQRLAATAEQRAERERVVLNEASWALIAGAPRAELEQRFEQMVRNETSPLLDATERQERRALLWRTFRERGLEGFRESRLPAVPLWPSRQIWYSDADPLVLLRPLALVACLLALAQALQHVAGSDDDLSRVSASLEWLFTFPVPARALFFARACSALFTGQLVWPLLFPFYAVTFVCSGLGAASVPLAVGAAAYHALLAGGLRVLLETTLRRYLPLAWVARVQAALLSLSVVAMLGSVATAYSRHVAWTFDWTLQLPGWVFLLPPSLPLWLTAGGARAGAAAAGAAGFATLWLALCVYTAERMVRAGVSGGGGPRAGRRGALESAARSQPPWAGVAYKELCAIFRDRRLRAQTFITPLLVFGMQFWLNPQLLSDITGGPRHVATAAFAVASFTLATGACTSLAMEGSSLWMLYTAPQRLERLLFQKLRVWICVAYLFAGAVLVLAWSRAPSLILPSLPYVVLTLLGIFLYAVIALGIGSLGTDPLEPEPRRRVRVGSVYLFMLLSSLFAYSIYAPSLWTKLVQLVLSALLAFALWQKLRDHLPYLLDPTAAPPPQIGVSDGIIAALGFFVLQGVFAFWFNDGGSEGRTLLLAFVSAGVSVTGFALFALYRSGVPRVLRALGLVRASDSRQSRWRQIALGLAAGLAAGGVALGYGLLLQRVSWLREWSERESTVLPDFESGSVPGWFVVLGVFAAPLFEEFIFRGILYRGLRRSVNARRAVLASALVFALVHPVVAAPPVFVMALLAASAYERTGWLATPIAAHMSYNAIVLASAALS